MYTASHARGNCTKMLLQKIIASWKKVYLLLKTFKETARRLFRWSSGLSSYVFTKVPHFPINIDQQHCSLVKDIQVKFRLESWSNI